MTKKNNLPNPKLIKAGIQYLRGKMTGNKRVELKGLANYLKEKYL